MFHFTEEKKQRSHARIPSKLYVNRDCRIYYEVCLDVTNDIVRKYPQRVVLAGSESVGAQIFKTTGTVVRWARTKKLTVKWR